jgi:transposase
MAIIPTLEEEDAKRPNRERENLVGQRTRIVNRMKSTLARLGIRGFKPHLRKAPDRLDQLRTAEGVPLPPNTLAELRRDMARLRFVMDQIRDLEAARLVRLEQHPEQPSHVMVRCSRGSSASASRRRTCWCTRSYPATCATAKLSLVEPVLGPAKGRTRGPA